MKVRDVIKMIEEDGWYYRRTRGSHRHFKHPFKPGLVTVSGHRLTSLPARSTISSSKLVLRTNLMRYTVVIEKGPTSFGAYVPDLPGCFAAAETRDEVVSLIKEAIEFHVEALREEGMPVPDPHSTAESVEVALV
jgi:predicted RNase H-like HicB family nuclease/predicted RNA binding protein YcfA (HicA-like mRNA interferase family)